MPVQPDTGWRLNLWTQDLKILPSKHAALGTVRRSWYWWLCCQKCSEAAGLWVRKRKRDFTLSDIDVAVAPGADLSGHAPKGPGMMDFFGFLVFFLPGNVFLASPLGYRKEHEFLPAPQHCTRKRDGEESSVRKVYFITLLWSTNPLVLRKDNFSCSNSFNKSINKGVGLLGVKKLTFSQLL